MSSQSEEEAWGARLPRQDGGPPIEGSKFAVIALQAKSPVSSKGPLDATIVALQANLLLPRINGLCARALPSPCRTLAFPL